MEVGFIERLVGKERDLGLGITAMKDLGIILIEGRYCFFTSSYPLTMGADTKDALPRPILQLYINQRLSMQMPFSLILPVIRAKRDGNFHRVYVW